LASYQLVGFRAAARLNAMAPEPQAAIEKLNASVRMAKPMPQPSTNDYLDSIKAALGRAVDRVQRVIEREMIAASQRGYYQNTIQRIVDSLQLEFNAGINVAIARLKRARKSNNLDYSELWVLTVQELENFKQQMKTIVYHEGLAAMTLSELTLVRSEIAKFDENLSAALRRYQEAVLEVGTPDDEAKLAAGNLGTPEGAGDAD
jgi:hypothetical protein